MARKRSHRIPAQPEPSEGAARAATNISIVLVEPQSSGNVGSVARAMKNTGLTNLVLINPCDYRNNESYSFACKADDVLLAARRAATLDEYLKDDGVVVGTTRRPGRLRYPALTLIEAVPKLLELAVENRVSILFGREDRGLENHEVALCDMLVEIPTHENYPSLNLSHAVFIVCHHLFMSLGDERCGIKAAPRIEVEKMYVHMEETFRGLGYGDKGGEYLLTSILRGFKKLFGRSSLMQKEVNMLRGIFTQIQQRIGR
ncbi:MAG: RNA methyltransferase [Deltaproteobacteria bacterium]|nr:RNA methyltransferase [Deltaproteobacteria bacterium]